MNFDTQKLAEVLHGLLSASIAYEMDGMVGKVRPLGKEVTEIKQLDCSGFVEYVIYQSTSDHTNLSAGSSKQRNDIKANVAHSRVNYEEKAPLLDNTVRIGFRKTITKPAVAATANAPAKPKEKLQVGHVWLVINGRTYESTSKNGKKQGPKSLHWSKRSNDVDYFYTLGSVPNFGMIQLASAAGRRIGSMFRR